MKSKIRETVDAALAAKTDAEAIRILKGRRPRRPRLPRKQKTGPLEAIFHASSAGLLKSIEDAGGVPSRKFKQALAAVRALDRINVQPLPPVEGSEYKVTLANGKDVTLFVPKGSDIFKLCKMNGYEMVSFVKIKNVVQ